MFAALSFHEPTDSEEAMLRAMEAGMEETDPLSPNYLRLAPAELGRLARMCCDLAHFVQGLCMHNALTGLLHLFKLHMSEISRTLTLK